MQRLVNVHWLSFSRFMRKGQSLGLFIGANKAPISMSLPHPFLRRLVTVAADPNYPTLKEIPSLPILGSTLAPWYSGLEKIDLQRFVWWWRATHLQHGPFYSMGVPGLGPGLQSRLYVVRDPNEMLKVLKQEGTYPSGVVEQIWPIRDWMKQRSFGAAGFFDRGAEWKRIRGFMQKDLLAPQSAREYLPVIIEGAEISSARMRDDPSMSEDLNRFLNYCGMDLFTGVLFGNHSGLAPEDYQSFCRTAVESMSKLFHLVYRPQHLLAQKLGFQTPLMRDFYDEFDFVTKTARNRLEAFTAAKEKGTLTAEEHNAYFYKLLERQPDSACTEQEAVEICVILMIVGVDTTAGKSAWNILQLALHPEIQDELYRQVKAHADANGGRLTPAIADGTTAPLLSAVIRETHRCTPAIPGDLRKIITAPTEVYGVKLPAGSMIMFDSLTNMMDEKLVDDPMTYRPHRWLKAEVEARKGTDKALMDHPFYSGPFSQGARRCPGSRVASLEIQVLLAQLLLDWKIVGPMGRTWDSIGMKLKTTAVPDFPREVQFVPRH